jgi:hypothetical protein
VVVALVPVWGIWTAITLDGVPQRRRFVEGLQLASGGWFTQLVNLPTEAVRPIFGDGFLRAVCLFLTALALAVIPLAAPPLLAGIRQVSSGVRTLCGRWTGVPIPSTYTPYPGHGPRFRWLLSDLAGRLPAPVESAAYFTVSELLVNVAKHARATSASVRIRTGERLLTITVADDGYGGADPSDGTGLRGLQRRLAAFDGTLTIDSPPGGPTAITLELPCAP